MTDLTPHHWINQNGRCDNGQTMDQGDKWMAVYLGRDLEAALNSPCPGTCTHAQANKARALELKRVRDELRTFIGDLDAAGMTSVALGINDILEGK